MRKGELTREQAIELAGIEIVNKLDYENCDYTNRVQTDGDTDVEFSASIRFIDQEGTQRTLTAYYYQNQGTLDETDFDNLDWEINGYAID